MILKLPTPKPFLTSVEYTDTYVVKDENGTLYGLDKNPEEAVKMARQKTNQPIKWNEFEGITSVCVSDEPTDAIKDPDTFISALAELAGMKVTKNFNDDMGFIGYTMELIE